LAFLSRFRPLLPLRAVAACIAPFFSIALHFAAFFFSYYTIVNDEEFLLFLSHAGTARQPELGEKCSKSSARD
jgi:hypothetical protein